MSTFEPIQLAVNYSPQAVSLKESGAIQFDLYKLPDWPDLVADINTKGKTYVHFTLAAGLRTPLNVDWQLVDRLLEITGTSFVNLHLSAPEDANSEDAHEMGSILEKAMADMNQVIDRYGAERVILENIPVVRRRDKCLLGVVTPPAICQVVERTGCGLLLDIAHARLAARALEIDEREYIQALPVQRLRELHITGIGLHDGYWVDHMEMLEADWQLLDWALEKISQGEWAYPQLASFEYGGIGAPFVWRSHEKVLAEQVPALVKRLQQMTKPAG